MFRALSVVLLALSTTSLAQANETPWWARGISSPTMVEYGVGFDGEFVLNAGGLCSSSAPCILGSGAGIAANLGVLYGRTTYLGVAYSLTKQDPSRLYRFATLQQGRIELRRYVASERDLRFFGTLGAGVAGYGEEWGVDTYGPLLSVAFGAELELSAKTVAVASIAYRGVSFTGFRDTAGNAREAGISHFLALEIALEARSNL
jgi:hypothetical protein